MEQITISLGGVNLNCRFQFAESACKFNRFLVPYEKTAPVVCLTDADNREWEKDGCDPSPQLEFSYLAGACSDVLMQFERCVFHAVALRHRGTAWLIAAAPGVGKTTLYLTLDHLYPGEFSVISGDRPVLSLIGENGVFVSPSPWNGKENIFGSDGAPLEGIILLSRGEENSLKQIKPYEAAALVFLSVIQTKNTEEGILRAASFTEKILQRIPVWSLVDRDVIAAGELLHKTLFEGRS